MAVRQIERESPLITYLHHIYIEYFDYLLNLHQNSRFVSVNNLFPKVLRIGIIQKIKNIISFRLVHKSQIMIMVYPTLTQGSIYIS